MKMNLKILFIGFLCFISAFLVLNTAITTANTPEWSYKTSTKAVYIDYPQTNGTKPTGDPIEDPGWPN